MWKCNPGEDKDFKELGMVENQIDPRTADRSIHDFTLTFTPVEARYLHVSLKNIGFCPSWHAGAGNKAWLFVDEIIVE